jgi:hypothetical protein
MACRRSRASRSIWTTSGCAYCLAVSVTGRPVRDRLLDAFDQWTGRYIGAMSREVNSMAEEHPDLLGPAVAG